MGLSSDAMCVQLRQSTGSGATLLVGLRAGRILKYNIEIHPASLGVSRDSRELLNFVSQGAVTHLEMVNETECVAAYTNGDVRITTLDLSLIFASWFYLTLVASASRRYGSSTDTETLSYLLWYVFRRLVIHRLTDYKGLAVHAKHRLLACAGQDARVRIWSLDDTSPLYDEAGPTSEPRPGQDSPLCTSIFPKPPQALAWCDAETMDIKGTASSSILPRLAVGVSQTVYIFAA